MNELVRLLVELSEDPFRREEFLNNPEAVLATANLSDKEREILLARDPEKILELFGPKGFLFCVLIVIFVFLTKSQEDHHLHELQDPDKEPSR